MRFTPAGACRSLLSFGISCANQDCGAEPQANTPPITGGRNVRLWMSFPKIISNLGASALELSAAELALLDAISELPPEYPGWMAYKGINRSNVLELDPEARRASGYS
jgi:hypothetical protein